LSTDQARDVRSESSHMLSGMVPMARSFASLVRSGRVARSVALAACEHRETLEKLLEERIGSRPRPAG
jgi:hypothetical protein